MSVVVTVTDEQTGESETVRVPDGEYLLTTVAPCYQSYVSAYANGTHVITVKGRRRGLFGRPAVPDGNAVEAPDLPS